VSYLRNCLFLLSFWLFAYLANAEQHISVIPVNNGTVEELVPVIEAQLGEGSSVSSYQNQIILNASDEETIKIKHLLDTLDHTGRQLLISVKNDNTGNMTLNNGSINQPKNSQFSAQLQMRKMHNSGQDNQGIRATEGYPSFITTGSAIAYNQPALKSNGKIIQNQQWQNALTGFYATAWINNNEVSIKIEQEKQRFTSNTSMDNQQLQTRVSGKLGEWIAIGNVSSHNITNEHSFSSVTHNQDNQTSTIYLKVELAE
jgi:hypothetical protein